ncbi:WW domain-binding protein 11-like [Thrips palmi]|uniref:WW domain-binding protein 11-like n=1 Tax=Thrips palmi TaxID=161013 RepID=A0A6P8Z8L3_THRPL|nr:WW domain-binding protein 11-like [Thrips palmi]
MLRRSARSSTVLLVLLLAVPAPAKRARYYEDEGAAPQRPLGPALGPALGPTYRRRDLADVWESYEDGPRPAALSMRREYRPYGTYWTLADDAPRPASAPRYPEEGYYIRRRFAAAAPRKADDGYPGEPYGGRYAVRWVPVRVDADQDLHQDDADDAPPWPERRKEPPRHLADLPVDDLPRRGRRPVELTATEQPRPSRRPPPDATTEDTTAKPLNVHLWVSVDEKTPLLVPSVLQASQPPVPPPSPPPTLPPSPPQQSPQRSAAPRTT